MGPLSFPDAVDDALLLLIHGDSDSLLKSAKRVPRMIGSQEADED